MDKNGKTSYRLFKREVDEDFQKKTVEYQLGFKDCNASKGVGLSKWGACKVWAQPSPVFDYHGVQKFFAGFGKPHKTCLRPSQPCNEYIWNCRLQQRVCLL